MKGRGADVSEYESELAAHVDFLYFHRGTPGVHAGSEIGDRPQPPRRRDYPCRFRERRRGGSWTRSVSWSRVTTI